MGLRKETVAAAARPSTVARATVAGSRESAAGSWRVRIMTAAPAGVPILRRAQNDKTKGRSSVRFLEQLVVELLVLLGDRRPAKALAEPGSFESQTAAGDLVL